MKILEACTNYFQGFQDIGHYKQNSAKTNALALLKIASYFTIVIPLGFAALFTAASLYGRANKIESPSSQDLSISNQAKRTIIKDNSKATPQERRNAAREAAEGEIIHTGPNGRSYEKLLNMINSASIEEIPYIIEGALSHQYPTGLKKVLGELLRRRDSDDSSSNKDKLKLAIQTVNEARLLKLVDKSKLPLLTEQLQHRIDFDHYNDLELELLQKYGKELSLSDEGIRQIREYTDHIKALCEKTKDKPQFMYE